MIRFLPAIVLLASSLSAATAEDQAIHHPFEVWAPPDVATRWDSYDHLPSRMNGKNPIRAVAPQERIGRIDVLRRDGGRWVWSSTHEYSVGSGHTLAPVHRGFLLRFKNDPHYFWAEVPANASAPAELVEFRNVSVSRAFTDTRLVLYLDSATLSRTLPEGQTTFHFVPLESGLLCAMRVTDARCSAIDPSSTRFDLSEAKSGDVRILRVEPQAEDEFQVLAKGNVAIRPKKAPVVVTSAGRWISLTLDTSTFVWDSLVVDRIGSDFAFARLLGAALAPAPAFTEVHPTRERGIVVRPWVGPKKAVLVDPEALLVVLAHGDGLSSQIPLTTASLDSEGRLQLSMLSSGSYALKLLSSQTTAEIVRVSVTAGVPLDVIFPTGPTVSGRVSRTLGGTANDPVFIEVAVELQPQEAVKSDLTEKVRFTTADGNGNFSLVLPSPGNYRLRARWGSASAARRFEIGKPMRDVELGEISLATHTTLRGSVMTTCRSGEAVLIPVPDFSRNLTIGFIDLRRTPVDEEGRFVVDGLTSGPWSILLLCEGQRTEVAPEFFYIPEQGDVILEFAPHAKRD